MMAVTIAVRTAGAGSFVSWAFRNASAARLRTSSRAKVWRRTTSVTFMNRCCS